MEPLVQAGRLLFALAVAALGVQQLLYADFVPGPLVAPPWLPSRTVWACVCGLALVAAALALGFGKGARWAPITLGVLFLAVVLVFHLPAPAAILGDGTARTRAFEALTLCGAAFVLAGTPLAALGRALFALPMAVFGVQHFLYAAFIATLIPAWIPAHLFWTYATGVAFVAAAVSLLSGVQARLAAFLLGLMFFLWFALLHAPRVLERWRDGNEWNSALVALALCGGAWAQAGSRARRG
jgi:uncharacterized membrane protein